MPALTPHCGNTTVMRAFALLDPGVPRADYKKKERRQTLCPLASIRAGLPWLKVSTHVYPSGGFDQINVIAEGFDASARTLKSEVMADATRLFNLRLMQKGACLNYRSHCMQLADQIHRL